MPIGNYNELDEFRGDIEQPTGSTLSPYELFLGYPAVSGYVLSSTIDGTRSWVASSGSGDVTLAGPNAFTGATNSFGSLNLDATASTLYGPDGRGIIPVAGETWLSGTSAYWNLFTDTVTGGASGTLNLATQKFSEGWGVSAAALPTFLFTLAGTSPLTTTFGMRENTDDIFWGGTQIMPNLYYSGSSLTRRDNTKSGAMLQLENYYCQNGGAVAAAGVDTTGDFFQFTDVTGSAGPVNFYPCTLNVVSGGLPSGLSVSTPYWFFAVNSTATTQTSGTLTTGAVYEITTYVAGDNFTNVGAASNASGVKFVATGTTPTTYTNGSTVTKLKAFRLGSSRANAVAGTAVNVTTQGTGSFIAAFRVNEINWTTQTASGQETRLINFVAPASDTSLGANLNLLLPVTQSIPRTSLDAEPSFIVQHDHVAGDNIPTTLQINGYDSLGVGSASRLRMNGSHADFSFWSGVNSGEAVGVNAFGLRDSTAGAWRMWLDSTGNIGLGNTAPATKLHVTGTVTATDFAGSGASLTGVNAATVTLASDSTDASNYVNFALAATGSQALKTSSLLRFNPVSGLLTTDAFAGALNGPVGITTPNTGSFTTGAFSSTITGTSNSVSALAVGANGATNPVLKVNANTASVATGLHITGAAAAGGLALAVISSGTNENLTIDAKGSGTITLGSNSTGNITLTRATTVSGGLITTLASGGNHLAFRTSDAPSTDKWINYVSGTSLAWYAASQDRLTLGSGGQLGVPGTLAVTGASTLAAALITTPEALAPALNAGITVSVTTVATGFALNGANAATLANGTNGQIKTLVCTAVTAAGTATLTPTTANGFSTVAFTAAGQTLTLQYFTTGGWVILSVRGATPA